MRCTTVHMPATRIPGCAVVINHIVMLVDAAERVSTSQTHQLLSNRHCIARCCLTHVRMDFGPYTSPLGNAPSS
jgi:hypothetical protein